MKTRKENLLLSLVLLAFAAPVHAEISGSGTPNSGCFNRLGGLLWHDLSGDGVADVGEPGLPGITLRLFYADGAGAVTAIADSTGRYEFQYLCEGAYLILVDEATVPEGLAVLFDDEGDDDDEPHDLGGWTIEIDGVDEQAVFDLPFQGCGLSVNGGCSVASLASELYRCEKPIDRLSMVWSGSQPVRVVAHLGDEDDDVIADIDDIAPGHTISVGGFADSPDNVVWEIFVAGTDNKLGESKFRMNCDDEEMDGPEDCGLAQGNGHDNKAGLINSWLLEGIVDDSGLLECTNRSASGDGCSFQAVPADCDMIDKANWLTFVYTGGTCGASQHHQPDKFECDGQVDDLSEATVTTESGEAFAVKPGGVFTIPKDGSDTEIALSNAGGTQELRIHTSCSQPLAAGDIYGGLTLAAINGLGIGAHVDFEYRLKNQTDTRVVARTHEAQARILQAATVPVDARSTRTVSGSAWVMNDISSAVVAEQDDPTLPVCGGADFVGVIVTPPAPCEISGSGWQYHDDELLWNLENRSTTTATVERLELRWPGSVTDKLKEIKLDGDKIFDDDRPGAAAVIENGELEGDLRHRKIPAGETLQLKIVFDDRIDAASPDDFAIELQFEQGCAITWQP